MWGLTARTFHCVLHGIELGIGLLRMPTVLRRVSSFRYDLLCIFIALGPMPGARGF